MNYAKEFQKVLDYIEAHLDSETDYEEMAALTGYSVYHFQRLFLMLTGMSAAGYIRNRRLAKAAAELMSGQNKVIDVSYKYGYSSPTAFNRAFRNMHGIAPSNMKQDGITIKAFPPITLDTSLKPAQKLDYRIQTLDSFRIIGKKLTSTLESGICYQEIPAFWEMFMKNGGPAALLPLMNQQPAGILGVSVCDLEMENSHFDYYIGVATDLPLPADTPMKFEEYIVPASVWGIFPHKNENPGMIQDFQKHIVLDWLPTSGYEFAKAPDIELYFDNGVMETWIPITNRAIR